MKKFLLFILLSCTLSLHAQQLPPREVRAVWLTTLFGLDWPSTRARSASGEAVQKAELTAIFDQLQRAGINTVLFQTRIRGTVAYPSAIEPWDEAFSGRYGEAPPYDPLQFAIDEAHKRGMELHAWVVAFPVCKLHAVKALGKRALPKVRPELCYKSNEEYIMDPGQPATGPYIASICEEIVRKYEVDGIHLDYIRYPENSVRFDDSRTFRRYGNGAQKAQWRRDNVTRVVREIHKAVKAVRPWVKLSCAPVGKYADLPRYSSKGWNARDAVFQDAIAWLNDGLMDQLYPMMYFDGNHFYPFAQAWKEEAKRGQIIPGLGTYMLHPNERNWSLETMQHQMNFLRFIGLDGYAMFRSKYFTNNTKGIYDWTKTRYHALPSLSPAIAPMHDTAAGIESPKLRTKRTHHRLELSWNAVTAPDETPICYNIYKECGDTLMPVALRIKNTSFSLTPVLPTTLDARYAVTAIDAYGRESSPSFTSPKPINTPTPLLRPGFLLKEKTGKQKTYKSVYLKK